MYCSSFCHYFMREIHYSYYYFEDLMEGSDFGWETSETGLFSTLYSEPSELRFVPVLTAPPHHHLTCVWRQGLLGVEGGWMYLHLRKASCQHLNPPQTQRLHFNELLLQLTAGGLRISCRIQVYCASVCLKFTVSYVETFYVTLGIMWHL